MARRKRKRPDPTQHDIETEGLPSSSGFDSEFRCPGKRQLCLQLPKEEDQAAANRGVRIHEAIQSWDLEKLAKDERRTAHRIMFGESQIVHQYGFEGADVTFEERVWDFDDNLDHTWSGRVDRYDWDANQSRLLVLDDKTGWTTVPLIEDNWQVRSEASLLAERLDARETVMGLIHPHDPDSLWEAHVYSRDETDELLDRTRHNVVKIQQPDQRRIAGGIQCQWCPAKRVCPEYKAAAEQLAQDISDEIEDEGFTTIIRRTKKERGNHVRWIKELVKNCEFMLEQYVQLELREPESIQGWKITRKLTRSVLNEATAIELVNNRFGADAMTASLVFNIVALETYLKEEQNMGAKDAKEAVRQCLFSVMEYKRGKYFLDEARSL